MPRIKILVADDGVLMRRLLVQQFSREADMEVVGEAADGREAVELALKLRPDVITMDLNMPHLNGIQAMERILARYPYIKVLLLTAHGDLVSLGRFSGALESLDKDCTPQELVAAVRRIYAARGPDTAGSCPTGNHRVTCERLATRAGLTEREKAVLERIVGTEESIKQIAKTLSIEWNREVTDASVKHAMERAIAKLRVEPRTRGALVKHVLEFDQSNDKDPSATL